MPTFAANLSMMFNEWAFLERFGAAADAGFEAVEFLFPYEHSPDAIATQLQRHKLTQALFNLPPGDWEAGDRGLASLPERASEFARGLTKALPYAQATGVRRVHMMAGLAKPTDPGARASYLASVRMASAFFAPHGVDVLIEPINGRDMPGYFLNNFNLAADIVEETSLPTVKLQFDMYHRQIIHGDVIMALRQLIPMIGHVQIAGVPSRNEPDAGELDYPALFRELDAVGYRGFVGCEYRPRAGTVEGLSWIANASQ